MPLKKTINIRSAGHISNDMPAGSIATLLDALPKNLISNVPWAAFPYQPYCVFAITNNANFIYLKFYVIEETVLARFTEPNDLVYKDSCVEFFISFNNEAKYYNLEFNSIGTAYIGYGNATERDKAPVEVVKLIKSHAASQQTNGGISWELTLVIPAGVFYHHPQADLLSGQAGANFYKCGDELPKPHYLAWNPIETKAPNFHTPEFFGELVFADVK